MKLPRTSAIVTVLTALAASMLAWSASTFHWTSVQTAASSGAGLATIGLVGFVVEHVRKETPSRWVGVLGMIPAEVSSVVTLGIVFAWWDTSATKVSGFVLAFVTPLAALAGVTIAQAKVTSPETLAGDLQAVAGNVTDYQTAPVVAADHPPIMP